MMLTLKEKSAQSLIDALIDACRQKETDNFILKSELEGAKREIDRLQMKIEAMQMQKMNQECALPDRPEVSE